jgi:hypothetical protein
VNEVSNIVLDILNKLDDSAVVNFIGKKAKEMSDDLKINQIVGNGIEYVLNKNDHQRLITNLSKQIKDYVLNNQEMVKERVKKESYFLVPKFVDDAIAEKITSGLSKYFDEVENDENHSLRNEITQKLYSFSKEVQTEQKWEDEFRGIKNDFLKEEKLHQYSKDIWNSIKKSLSKELDEEQSALKTYLKKNLSELSQNLQTDEKFQHKNRPLGSGNCL